MKTGMMTRLGMESKSEEDMVRRSIPQKRKIYYTDMDSSFEGEEEESNDHDQQRFPVTCGDKRGLLYRERLKTGLDCIWSEGLWFSLSAFEKFGGKGTHKKWKTTIFYKNKCLDYWIKWNKISAPPRKRPHFAASRPLDHDNYVPQESAEKEGSSDEQPSESGEEPTNEENGEGMNGSSITIESSLLQEKPAVILIKLEDKDQLIDTLRPKGSCSIEGMDEGGDVDMEETPSTQEGMETEANTSPQNLQHEKEVEVHRQEDSENTMPMNSVDIQSPTTPQTEAIIMRSSIVVEQDDNRPPQADSPSPVSEDTAPAPLPRMVLKPMKQLKKDKLKLEIKLLKIQKEYYTLKRNKLIENS